MEHLIVRDGGSLAVFRVATIHAEELMCICGINMQVSADATIYQGDCCV